MSGIYAQKLDPMGNALWSETGMPVGQGGIIYYSVTANGSGGAAFIYNAGKNGLRAQRLDADGEKMWGPMMA